MASTLSQIACEKCGAQFTRKRHEHTMCRACHRTLGPASPSSAAAVTGSAAMSVAAMAVSATSTARPVDTSVTDATAVAASGDTTSKGNASVVIVAAAAVSPIDSGSKRVGSEMCIQCGVAFEPQRASHKSCQTCFKTTGAPMNATAGAFVAPTSPVGGMAMMHATVTSPLATTALSMLPPGGGHALPHLPLSNEPHQTSRGHYVLGALYPHDESHLLEFKALDAAAGDQVAWLNFLLHKLINGFLNRVPTLGDGAGGDGGDDAELYGTVLFGVRNDGRVLGFSAPSELRDAMCQSVDSIVRKQVAHNGAQGQLAPSDVQVRFVPVVMPGTHERAEPGDVHVMEVRIRSCVDRCPLYTVGSVDGAAYERLNASTRELKTGLIVGRVWHWVETRRPRGLLERLSACVG